MPENPCYLYAAARLRDEILSCLVAELRPFVKSEDEIADMIRANPTDPEWAHLVAEAAR